MEILSMLNMKKTVVAILALSSGVVFAGTMGPVCSAINVTAPCESTSWEFGGKALYLDPSVGGFTSQETVSTVGGSATLGQRPHWNWGFMIEGAYNFNTGNDFNLNWYHINHSNSRKVGAKGTFNSTALGLDTPGRAALTSVTPTTHPDWDAVNFEFGQRMFVTDNKNVRFHGGIQYARVANDETMTAVGTFTPTGGVATNLLIHRVNNVSYNGLGPRVGADLNYGWDNGLAVYANGATALLAGKSKFSQSYTDTGITTNGSNLSVVPELEAKLGFTYTYAMAQGDLALDAGWMWVNYFDPISTPATHALNGISSSNFGVQGPFAGLKWMGNLA
ncbi:Lpg1974 family pore-forming outer membrane protein [bacterium]|nr:Lpg1974 family pore-forming outer membrane protein [bacterium]